MLRCVLVALISAGLALAQQPPANPVIEAVLNGASFENRLALGVLASVFGSNLAGTTQLPDRPPGPPNWRGSRSSSTASPRRLSLVSPFQISLQIPIDLPTGPATVQVERKVDSQVLRSASVNVTLDKYAPTLYTISGGKGLGAFALPGGQIAGPCTTAKPGDTVSAYAAGLGPTDPLVPAGTLTPESPWPWPLTLVQPKVTVGGKQAEVLASGLCPNIVALYFLRFREWAWNGTKTGDRQPFAEAANGVCPRFLPTRIAVSESQLVLRKLSSASGHSVQ